MIRSFSDLISRWPSIGAYADDMGLKYVTAQMQRYRDSIPATYWPAVVKVAKKRGISGVTLELLASLAADRASRAA